MRRDIDFSSIAKWLMELSDTVPVRGFTVPPGTTILSPFIIITVQGDQDALQSIFGSDMHFPVTRPEGCQQQAQLPGQTSQAEAAEHYPTLPPELATPKAMKLWRRAQRQGWVDKHYQPVKMPRTKAAVMASEMAKILQLEDNWKHFEQLWHRKQMAADYAHAGDLDNTLTWLDILKKTFKNV